MIFGTKLNSILNLVIFGTNLNSVLSLVIFGTNLNSVLNLVIFGTNSNSVLSDFWNLFKQQSTSCTDDAYTLPCWLF